MPGIKSKIFNFLIRNRHFFKGKLKKETFDLTTSINDFREECEKGANKYVKIPAGVQIIEETIEGIKTEWLEPGGADKSKLIFYVHGGGYVSGSCNDHRSFVSKLADDSGFTCIQYEYRLAPEHPFPAALHDSLKVYKAVLKKGFEPNNIVFAGESAGGGLTLALLLYIKEHKLPFPKAAVVISPWTDLSCSGESYISKNKVSVAPMNSWLVFSKHYVGVHDNKNPFISPLFGELGGLPPLFINSAVDDELFDDGEQFYLKAKKAGVDVQFRAGEGMVHCYPLMAPMFREATEAMEEILGFIKIHLG